MGIIENLQWDNDLPRYAAYPEVQASIPIVSGSRPALRADGTLYAGGWTDGIDRVSNTRDSNTTYSFSSVIVGARLQFALLRAPVTFFTGLSHHFLWADYIGGTSMGTPGRDYRDGLNAAEVGFRLHFPISKNLEVGGGPHWYMSLPMSEGDPKNARAAYLVSVSYRH